MNPRNKLFFFDFCNTLVRSNSTLDFLKFLYQDFSVANKIKFYSIWVVAKLLKSAKIIDENEYIRLRIRVLEGFSINQLRKYSQKFFEEYLSNNLIQPVYKYFIDLLEGKSNVIIISNTIDLILEPFATYHNIPFYFGSQLSYDENDTCRGTYHLLVNEIGKLNILLKFYDSDQLEKSFFITDDILTDHDLFEFVGEAVQVDLITEETWGDRG